MTRPTVLDMDLVVVPREATDEMLSSMGDMHMPFGEMVAAYDGAIFASPYPTAWDDVRKYVEGLERERDEATGTLRYCEKQWSDERGVMIDKFVYERNRAEAAESQLSEIAGHMDSECDSDSILHVVREAEADRDIYKDRAEAAEARIAELEKRLADAERVIEPFAAYAAKDGFGLDFHEKPLPDEDSPGWVYVTNGDFRAARAYIDGK